MNVDLHLITKLQIRLEIALFSNVHLKTLYWCAIFLSYSNMLKN